MYPVTVNRVRARMIFCDWTYLHFRQLGLRSGKGQRFARRQREHYAIIGDGSLSGGEALEGLDFAAELNSNLIIVVNDNDMSIAENHGGLYQNLKQLRDTDGKAACNLFRAMGLDYVFVKNGNDIPSLIEAFKQVKDSTYPVVVHICTQKGKGYAPAEQDKETWHWCMPFDPETGKPLLADAGEDYSELTAQYLLEKMKKDPAVVGITSATPPILGFTPDRRKLAGKQFVDVGLRKKQQLHWLPASQPMAVSRYTVYTAPLFSAPMISCHRICVSTAMLRQFWSLRHRYMV